MGYWSAHSDLDWYAECGMFDELPQDDDPDAREERAYRMGWSASMEWLAREPPEELDFNSAVAWLEGYDDAADAPLGSAP